MKKAPIDVKRLSDKALNKALRKLGYECLEDCEWEDYERELRFPVPVDRTSIASVFVGEDPMQAYVALKLKDWLSFPETGDDARALMLEWWGRINTDYIADDNYVADLVSAMSKHVQRANRKRK